MRLHVLALSMIAACLLTAACQLNQPQTPTVPEPTTTTTAPTPAGPAPPPTPLLGSPGKPSPSPTPTPSPGTTPEPTPTSTPPPSASGCGDPVPPAISRINVTVHLRGADAWTLDSTPLVGPDPDYCRAIGFTDGRSFCPVRPEGNPERAACEAYVTGIATDTGRPGPTWTFDGHFCTGPASGCANSPDNQYQLLVYKGGTYQACSTSGVCGEVFADR